MLDLDSAALGRDELTVVVVTGLSVRALGRSGFVVSLSLESGGRSREDSAALPVSDAVASGVASGGISRAVAGADLASLTFSSEGFGSAGFAPAGFASAGFVFASGASFGVSGLATTGAGMPMSVAERERATGARVLRAAGGLLVADAGAGLLGGAGGLEAVGGRLLVGRGGVDAGRAGALLGRTDGVLRGVLVAAALAGVAASGFVESLALGAGAGAGA